MIAAFVQDKHTIERGLFDEELVPEELTQVRMGKIIRTNIPSLTLKIRRRYASTPSPPSTLRSRPSGLSPKARATDRPTPP